ncbi:MAG: hypothetical protein ACI9HK_001337 [Pirellulaceae bacterium]
MGLVALAYNHLTGETPPLESPAKSELGGIHWFATLMPALEFAERTNRPILFMSAAPHCGGVSGVW